MNQPACQPFNGTAFRVTNNGSWQPVEKWAWLRADCAGTLETTARGNARDAHASRLALWMASWFCLEGSGWAQSDTAMPVAIDQDASAFTLSNGMVRARASKRSGDLVSLQYKEYEVLTDQSRHAGAYWSHDSTGGKQTATRICIDPAVNGGGVIPRHGIQGLWYERALAFDAALLKQGTNVLKLIVPEGPINNGVLYDYIRLELEEAPSRSPTLAAAGHPRELATNAHPSPD